MQITGSILQPNISGNIQLSRGEAYLPHDKGSGAASSNKVLPDQFFSPESTALKTRFHQPRGDLHIFIFVASHYVRISQAIIVFLL